MYNLIEYDLKQSEQPIHLDRKGLVSRPEQEWTVIRPQGPTSVCSL